MPAVLKTATFIVVSVLTCTAQDCLTRKLLVNISTEQLERIATIDRSKVTGKYGASPVEIVSIAPKKLAPRLLILIDASGSMDVSRINGENQVIRPVVESVLRAIPTGTSPAVGLFDVHLQEFSGFSSDAAIVRQWFRDVQTNEKKRAIRKSAIFDSMAEAAEKFGDVREGDSIFVITDGGDNSSKRRNDSLELLTRSGIRIFVLAASTPSDPPNQYAIPRLPDEIEGTNALEQVSEKTGGLFFAFNRNLRTGDPSVAKTSSAVAQRMLSRVTNVFELTVRLPERFHPKTKLKLEVAKSERARFGRLRVEYPQFFSECDQPGQLAAQ